MKVAQIRIKVYLLQDIPAMQIQEKITALIDRGFEKDQTLLQRHEENKYKNYCYDLPYPLEKDRIYKKGKIYTLTVRTIETELANYFQKVCVNQYTAEMKALLSEVKILQPKLIESLYTLTPAILKEEKGYWKTHMRLEEFEQRLKINLIKKWNCFEKQKMTEDFPLYSTLEFLNQKPIVMEYKNVRLLGDKLRMRIAENENAQKLAYMALGTGVLEMNARGAGFVGYRWL